MTSPPLTRRFRHAGPGFALGLLLLGCLVAQAQSPSEHASHHPGAAPAAADAMPPTAAPNNPTATAPGGMAPMPAAPAQGAAPAAPGGMADMQKMMGEMMGKAGMPAPASGSPAAPGMTLPGATAPPPGRMSGGGEMEGGTGCCGGASSKPLYAFLMSLSELTPQNRNEIERLGQERIDAGAMLMENAREGLSNALQAGDHTAAERALQQIREGSAELESGIAAHRVLRDGVPPKLVALAWFKTDMGLPPPNLHPGTGESAGISVFHIFTMALLVIFAFLMLAIYFLKMRRASALFGRIEPDDKSPAPGAAPPLAGAAPK